MSLDDIRNVSAECEQLSLLRQAVGARVEVLRFDGETYEPEHDKERLGKQLGAVKALMLDGRWRSLGAIRDAIGAKSDASVSARLRDLRKGRFGAFDVQRRRVGEDRNGFFEYRVVTP